MLSSTFEFDLKWVIPTVDQFHFSGNNETEDEDLMRDVMNLYEIGKFLEFNFLSQCCEDLLMQTMGIHNVVDILHWSLEPQGSAWIARQAYQYLEEEFYNFSSNVELLGKVDRDTLIRVMKSDFTQVRRHQNFQIAHVTEAKFNHH